MKTKLAKFLFKHAIDLNSFLQNRDDNFYSKYLEELKTEKFKREEFITRKGQEPEWVYFILTGVVINRAT